MEGKWRAGRTCTVPLLERASGYAGKFVGGSGPGCGVGEVEPAGGVEGVFDRPGWGA
jgi:hypothetical protein